jgi:hypothetical protein
MSYHSTSDIYDFPVNKVVGVTLTGILRRARNLALGALIEAVRDQTRAVDLKQVNAVLTQPHWRKDYDLPAL